MISTIVQALSMLLFASALFSLAILLKGCYVLRRQARRSSHDFTTVLLKSPQMPKVSVIAVPVDSSAESLSFIRRLLDLHSSLHEVILVLNGPSDPDFELWRREFQLRQRPAGNWISDGASRLQVLRTAPGTWAAAYNAGLARAEGALIGILDPESRFVPDVLLHLALPLLTDPTGTDAACGTAPEGTADSLIEQFAGLEALRLYLGRCAAFSGWNMLLPVPGSSLVVRREVVVRAGGFPESDHGRSGLAAPLELILHLHGEARRNGVPFRVALVPRLVSWIVPSKSEAGLRRLVVRDQQALAALLFGRNHIARGIRALGWGLPALLYWRLVRPLLETVLYGLVLIAMVVGWAPLQAGALVLLCTVGAGILVSMGAVVLRDLAEYNGSDPVRLAKLFLAAIPENLGYRQVRNFWLVEGFFR